MVRSRASRGARTTRAAARGFTHGARRTSMDFMDAVPAALRGAPEGNRTSGTLSYKLLPPPPPPPLHLECSGDMQSALSLIEAQNRTIATLTAELDILRGTVAGKLHDSEVFSVTPAAESVASVKSALSALDARVSYIDQQMVNTHRMLSAHRNSVQELIVHSMSNLAADIG